MLKVLKIDQLVADPNQPRQNFEPRAMLMLKESVKANGVLTPLNVEEQGDKYLIIDGERRYRTAKTLGLKELPVSIQPPMSETERMIFRFHVQEQHDNWTIFDKAVAISMLKKSSGLSNQEMANILGLNKSNIEDYIALLSLTKETVVMANEKKIPFNLLRRVKRISTFADNVKTKNKLEKALIEKIEDGIIYNAGHMSAYSICLKREKDDVIKNKLINKIIDDEGYSPIRILRDCKVGDVHNHQKVLNQMNWMSDVLEKIMKDKMAVTVLPADEGKLKRLVEVCEKYLNFIS